MQSDSYHEDMYFEIETLNDIESHDTNTDTTQKSLYITLNTYKAHLAALTTKLEAKYDWEKRMHPESALFLVRAVHHNVGLMPYLPACIHTHKFNLVQHAVATRYRERWRRNIEPACGLNCPFCDADL